MKTRDVTAILLLAAGPALAGASTASEREVTRELNLQQAQMVPAAQPQFTDATAGMPPNSPPAAAPTAKIESISLGAQRPAG